MTNLFRELMPKAKPQDHAQPNSSTSDFINEASKQGFTMSVSDFFRFAKMAEGKDMGAVVQELRESGAIDEATFQDLKQKASGFLSLIKMATGK